MSQDAFQNQSPHRPEDEAASGQKMAGFPALNLPSGQWLCPCGYVNAGVICTKCGECPGCECGGPLPCPGPHGSD